MLFLAKKYSDSCIHERKNETKWNWMKERKKDQTKYIEGSCFSAGKNNKMKKSGKREMNLHILPV